MLASTTAALLAATVPAVIPSIDSKSFSFISAEPITKLPPVIAPVVVIADEPVSIVPKPDVIVPELRAPVLTRLGIAVISSSKYAARSVTAT